jgi:2-polyprenyl-6-hydroxyphenyl methylase/3-demethylubiquinone-9 3-methyltransferase
MAPALGPHLRVLDVGCGNGAMAAEFLRRGCRVTGVDLSREGVEVARAAYPTARFEVMEAGQDILARLGEDPYDLVISTETIEHLYDPRSYAEGCFAATRPGGHFLISTPYHGYAKNLVLSLLNQWDAHIDPFWRGGHIKLWSYRTLARLLRESGFTDIRFRGAGRVPYLWKSMVLSAVRPEPGSRLLPFERGPARAFDSAL